MLSISHQDQVLDKRLHENIKSVSFLWLCGLPWKFYWLRVLSGILKMVVSHNDMFELTLCIHFLLMGLPLKDWWDTLQQVCMIKHGTLLNDGVLRNTKFAYPRKTFIGWVFPYPRINSPFWVWWPFAIYLKSSNTNRVVKAFHVTASRFCLLFETIDIKNDKFLANNVNIPSIFCIRFLKLHDKFPQWGLWLLKANLGVVIVFISRNCGTSCGCFQSSVLYLPLYTLKSEFYHKTCYLFTHCS